jgi:hypothetical protein
MNRRYILKMTPFDARLVPHIFRWSNDFSRRSHFVLGAAGKASMLTQGDHAARSKLFEICALPLPPCRTYSL